MESKGRMEGLPNTSTYLEEPCAICLLNKAIITPQGHTIDVSKFDPGCMLQIDVYLFNV